MTDKTVLHLLSGGLDSVVALKDVVDRYGADEVHCLYIDYNQNAAEVEKQLSRKVADKLGVEIEEHETSVFTGLDHPLIADGPELEDEQYEEVVKAEQGEGETNEQTYLASRNIVLLSIASVYADKVNAKYISGGFAAEEGTVAPDNNPEFFENAEKTLVPSTVEEILMPAGIYSQPELIERAFEIDAPIEFSTSCYREGPEPCDACRGCHTREWAFKEAGKDDPYRETWKKVFGLGRFQ